MQTAIKYEIDVTHAGQIELHVPYPAGKHLTVLVLSEEEFFEKPTVEGSIATLYAEEKITFKQAQGLFNHTDWQETAAVLEQQGCKLYYDENDFEDDLETLKSFEDKIENS